MQNRLNLALQMTIMYTVLVNNTEIYRKIIKIHCSLIEKQFLANEVYRCLFYAALQLHAFGYNMCIFT